jgi:AmiR/NasT family two-component response regulator
VAQAFASYASLAMANAYLEDARRTLARHLDVAMDSAAVIEQAKGIIMSDRRCAPGEAFAILTTMARDTGRSIRDVARALLDRTAETPAE